MTRFKLGCTFTFDDELTEEQAISQLKQLIPNAFCVMVETECSGIFYVTFECNKLLLFDVIEKFIYDNDLLGECFDVRDSEGILIYTELEIFGK
jgi:hypothetical protein